MCWKMRQEGSNLQSKSRHPPSLVLSPTFHPQHLLMPTSRLVQAAIVLVAAVLAARFFVVWPSLWPLRNIEMSTIDPSFSPERCADLHNQLLRRAIENNPNVVVERTLVQRFLDVAPEFSSIPNLEALPLHRFFSLLDTTPLPRGRIGVLTPEMYQPDPMAFWSEAFGDESSIILLYGQNNANSPMDGGIFLDLRTCKAVWHWSPGPFPPADRWVSLETALQVQLDKWESGKFYWNSTQAAVAISRWTQKDLADALSAWDDLLSAIESALGRAGQAAPPRRSDPLDSERMLEFHVGKFAREFLSRAPRPEFKYIAPGVTTFSPDLLEQIYSSENPESFRRTFDLGTPEEEEWASLLFPATSTVPEDVPRNSDLDIKSFDEDWGYGKFTVSRQAGLYIDADSVDSDVVRLITSSGLPTACQFDGRCPWGPSRSPRLSEVLRQWASFVSKGIWTVDTDGVATDHDWFQRNFLQTKLEWERT